MTRRSILEYAQVIRSRYSGASKLEKGKILDEVVIIPKAFTSSLSVP